MYIPIYILIYILVYIPIYIPIYILICILVYIPINRHLHIYKYVYIYTYIHTPETAIHLFSDLSCIPISSDPSSSEVSGKDAIFSPSQKISSPPINESSVFKRKLVVGFRECFQNLP